MRKHLGLLAFFVIAAIMIAGCTGTQPAPQPTTTAPTPLPTVIVPASTPAVPAQLAGNWIITTMGIQDGTAVIKPASSDITLTFQADGTVAGNGGCNNYNGPYTLTGATTPKGKGIAIGPLASTKMFCQQYSDQETMYLNILQKAMAYNVDGNQLSVTATTGDVLIYQRHA